ncbi:hypothetical protein DF026_36005 [Burkholderia stagnalis]|nr:hypothetical protein DF026_36005 [Burkholderia stagnalis]
MTVEAIPYRILAMVMSHHGRPRWPSSPSRRFFEFLVDSLIGRVVGKWPQIQDIAMRVFFRSTSRVLRASKIHAKITGLPLHAAQNEIAYILGYADLHELQQTSANEVHEPSPDDEDLSQEELRQRREYQADRLVAYRRAPGRKPLDAMTARGIVDDVRAAARVRSVPGNAPTPVRPAPVSTPTRKVVVLAALDAIVYVDRDSRDLVLEAKTPQALDELLKRVDAPINASTNRITFVEGEVTGRSLAFEKFKDFAVQLGVSDSAIRQVEALTAAPAPAAEPVRSPLSTRERTGERPDLFQDAPNEVTRFPQDEIIYGIVVRASTTYAELAEKSRILSRMDPDRIVLLSVSPHDVMKRSDWPDVELLFRSLVAHFVVERLNERDIDRIATEISVMV